jgi:hypothetical protein
LIKGKLNDEKFFHSIYDTTLKTSFPEDLNADNIVVEGGKTE